MPKEHKKSLAGKYSGCEKMPSVYTFAGPRSDIASLVGNLTEECGVPDMSSKVPMFLCNTAKIQRPTSEELLSTEARRVDQDPWVW